MASVVGNGSGSTPGSILPEFLGCFSMFQLRLFLFGGLKWPETSLTRCERLLS